MRKFVNNSKSPLEKMQELCIANNIYRFCDLSDYLSKNRPDLLRILCNSNSCVYYMCKFLEKRYWKLINHK